ncbi:2-keto-3-deoxygluconate kinase [Lysinibacillus sp. 54212]|uniref:2-keto-3-deoxygluconate kinase n=1 Tax=Lysinibacillus sp. 54212 TaxID=3119829 RepID=UPI002FC81BC3
MRKEKCERGRGGAQTFRRGRALMFYQQLVTKRDTLKKQLEAPELQSIQPVIAGELKATEAIMNDFKVVFGLDELTERQEQE